MQRVGKHRRDNMYCIEGLYSERKLQIMKGGRDSKKETICICGVSFLSLVLSLHDCRLYTNAFSFYHLYTFFQTKTMIMCQKILEIAKPHLLSPLLSSSLIDL